ncbi:methylenetetrahydrofolate reductase [Brevibacterium ammoniilyticum]|uniref:Methylenetetrahydrofolate reductase n=1 Tax=Brevibacterium ammoniilyticum TaxID=1046555 RepID=A0ABP9U496_9MICO
MQSNSSDAPASAAGATQTPTSASAEATGRAPGSADHAWPEFGYEVMPFKGIFESVTASVPTDVPLTVTASPNKTIEDTVKLAVRFHADGYRVAPHLSARMIRNRDHLGELLTDLQAGGIRELFVIGGDAEPPAGDYVDALGLLRDIASFDLAWDRIGIGGYPEGHPKIDDAKLLQALVAKQPFATHIVTQICFSAEATATWLRQLRAAGVTLPVRIGVPGAIERTKLIRISSSVGVGESMNFLRKQQSMFWRFFVPGGYNPTKLVKAYRKHFSAPDVEGFHIFTFNSVKSTEEWRRKMNSH